jgi:hypothetical protein
VKENYGDRILFGYAGDYLCKYSTTGMAITHQKNYAVTQFNGRETGRSYSPMSSPKLAG